MTNTQTRERINHTILENYWRETRAKDGYITVELYSQGEKVDSLCLSYHDIDPLKYNEISVRIKGVWKTYKELYVERYPTKERTVDVTVGVSGFRTDIDEIFMKFYR